MTYEETIAYIHSFVRFTEKRGHHRLKALLTKLGSPQDKLRFVHITGTNGKGSAAVMLSEILRRSGVKTGLFISPYVLDFRERIQVNGEWIPKEELISCMEAIRPLAEEQNATGDQLNEFEVVTALGLLYFAKAGCQIVCLEAGMGGENDSTNVIGTPLVSVIMKISLDHTEVLGDTVEQIAWEKAGIIKPGGITVSYPDQSDGALAVLMEACAVKGNPLLIPNPSGVQVLENGLRGTCFRYGEGEYTVPFAGPHQVHNALTVLEAARALMSKGIPITEDSIREGMKNARFPARFELVHEHPSVIIDGAHNPDGMGALANTVAACGLKKPVAILGMMKDKAIKEAVGKLAPLCEKIFTVPVHNPRAASPEELAKIAQNHCPDVTACQSGEEALFLAYEAAGKDGTVIVCGSLYLAGEMRELILSDGGEKKPLRKDNN